MKNEKQKEKKKITTVYLSEKSIQALSDEATLRGTSKSLIVDILLSEYLVNGRLGAKFDVLLAEGTISPSERANRAWETKRKKMQMKNDEMMEKVREINGGNEK